MCSSMYPTVDIVIGQRRPRSDCANAQSDLGLFCPFKGKCLFLSTFSINEKSARIYDDMRSSLFKIFV